MSTTHLSYQKQISGLLKRDNRLRVPRLMAMIAIFLVAVTLLVQVGSAAPFVGADIVLNGSDFSAISAIYDGINEQGWEVDGTAILTWWGDEWVEYEVNLTPGLWQVGLEAINQGYLGEDPWAYPSFELSLSLSDEILEVQASDTETHHGFVVFDVSAAGTYTIRFTWLNDWGGESETGEPLDANLKIERVFFDAVPDLAPGQWIENPTNGHLYALTDDGLSFAEAEAQAVSWGGHLVTINDQTEQDWLYEQFGSWYYMIGLNDIDEEGSFVWESGELVTYTNWCWGEPNDASPGEDAVHMIRWSQCWNDVPGDYSTGIVEVSPDPHFNVAYESFPAGDDFIHLYGWLPSSTLTISIDDPATGPGIDHQVADIAVVSTEGFNVNVGPDFDIQTGHSVTVTDGFSYLTHVVTNLQITTANIQNNLVHGIGEPGNPIMVTSHSYPVGEYWVNPAGDGSWQVDMSVDNLQAGYHLTAHQYDEYGNNTQYDFEILNPIVEVNPFFDTARVLDWPLGASVTLSIDDDADPENGVIHSVNVVVEEATDEGEPAATIGFIDLLQDVDVIPGQFVRATDGFVTKEHVVTQLGVVDVNTVTDVFTGTAKPGGKVLIFASNETGFGRRDVTANDSGQWTADFSIEPADTADGYGTVDLYGNYWFVLGESDEDFDSTVWHKPEGSPGILAVPDLDVINIDATGFSPITVTIESAVGELLYQDTMEVVRGGQAGDIGGFAFPDSYPFVDSPIGYPGARLELDGVLDLAPGQVITWSDAAYTVDIIVADLVVDEADLTSGTLSGGTGETTPFVWGALQDFQAYGSAELTTGAWSMAFCEAGTSPDDGSCIPRDLTHNDLGMVFAGYASDFRTYTGTVWNTHPVISELSLTTDPLYAGVPVNLSATFTDIEVPDSHTATVDWDDGTDLEALVVTPGSGPGSGGSVAGTHVYTTAGSYQVTLTVTDASDESDTAATAIVIFESLHPWLEVRLTQNSLWSEEWLLGYPVELTIDDPATTANPDYNASINPDPLWYNPQIGQVSVQLADAFRILPGHLVTLSNGFQTKEHTVSAFQVTDFDYENDVICGTAEPGFEVEVQIEYFGLFFQRDATTDGDGSWCVDFSIPGETENEQSTYDLLPFTEGTAHIRDDDGDSTQLTFPYEISAWIAGDRIHAHNWLADEVVMLEIDDPLTSESPDYTAYGTPEAGPWFLSGVEFHLQDQFDIQPGQMIRISQRDWMKELIVSPEVEITAMNYLTDSINGKAAPGAHLRVECQEGLRYTIADSLGNWTVDFSIPGAHFGEQELVDLLPGDGIQVAMSDQDADSTIINTQVPSPWIDAIKTTNEVVAISFPQGATVALTVDDPATTQSPDYTASQEIGAGTANWSDLVSYQPIELPHWLDLQAGFIVTLSDSQINKHTILTPLEITDVDLVEDKVFGFAPPGARIRILVIAEVGVSRRNAIAGSNGIWEANFAVPGSLDEEQEIADINPTSLIRVHQYDEDGDRTHVTWVYNWPPLTVDDSFATNQNEPLVVAEPGLLANDSDPDDGSLTAHLGDPPAHGTVTLNLDGSFTYTPDAGWYGTDSFTYVANDGQASSNVATVTITVNRPPIAHADEYFVGQGETLTTAVDVQWYYASELINSSTGGTSPLLAPHVVAVDALGNAYVTGWASNNVFKVTPGGNASLILGPEGDGTENLIGPADIATDPAGNVFVIGGASGNLFHITPDGAITRVEVDYGDGSPRAVTVDDDGNIYVAVYFSNREEFLVFRTYPSLTYSHLFAGPFLGDMFSGGLATDDSLALWIAAPGMDRVYRIASTGGVLDSWTVPDARVVATHGNEGYAATLQHVVWKISTAGAVTQVMDASGDGATPLIEPRSIETDTSGAVYVASHGSHSVFQLRPDGSVKRVLAVTANQLAVTPNGTLYVTDADNELIYRAERADGILDNDFDPDGDSLNPVLVNDVAHGELAFSADGSYSYTPEPSFVGIDTFTYRASDGVGTSSIITAKIHVIANQPPVATNDNYTIDQDSSLSIPVPGLLGNDYDSEGDRITAWLVTGPSHGTLDLNPDGSFTYQPFSGYQGDDSFRYQVLDAKGNRDEAYVSINSVPAVTCVVDTTGSGNYTTITEALADLTCTRIEIRPGTYTSNLRIDRNVELAGSGQDSTILQGWIQIWDRGVKIVIRDLTQTGSNLPYAIQSCGITSLIDMTVKNNTGYTGFDFRNDWFGAITNCGDMTISRVTVLNNGPLTPSYTSGAGGGISNHGRMSITSSKINSNRGRIGGGIFNCGGHTERFLSILDSEIRGNYARQGGGLYALGEISIENSLFVGNTATLNGGGIYLNGLRGHPMSISNSTISENTSIKGAGLHLIESPDVLLENVTITRNFFPTSEGVGGGIFWEGEPGSIILTNTIVANNGGVGSPSGVQGMFPEYWGEYSLTTGGHNLFGEWYNPSMIVPGEGDLLNADPLLAPLADNGGPTLTHALLPGSPAIDAGSSTLATDQRGVPRPQGAAPDIGAYEHLPDEDSDGISDPIEDGAPNGGDGNADGVPDRDQNNVASLPNAVTGEYVTLETDDPISAVVTTVPPVAPPENLKMPVGLMSFVVDPLSTNELTVTLYLPLDTDLDAYWKYGPTLENPYDHWYEFLFDGTTGAEITHETDRTVIVLHYVDGQRGDSDLISDGRLVDPGGPAIILNQPPVANNDLYSTDEDTPLVVDVPDVLANDTDEDGDPLTASLIEGPFHGDLTLYPDGSFSYTPDPDWFGEDTFTYLAHDGELDSNEAAVTIQVIPVNDLPIATVTPTEQTVQYSDPIKPITIEVADIDSASISAAAADLPEGVALSGSPCEVPCSLTISGNVADAAGTYEATITLDDGIDTVDSAVAIIVEPEDAVIPFDDDNEIAFRVDSAGGTGTVELSALVREAIPDLPEGLAATGDITKAEMTMTLVPVGPGSNVIGSCSPDSVTGTGYDALLPVTCTFTEVEVNTYTVEALVTGGYYVSSMIEDVVVVYDPSLGFTTGGGWFFWPGSTDKTNFGYTMKYNKKGQRVKGSLLLIRHTEDGSIYRIKSNALYGLALGESAEFGWASFSGKATYLEPGMVEPEGNHEFMLYVEDYGEPGSDSDQVWLEVHDKSGEVILVLSMPRPANRNTTTINGGNIVVPH